MMFSESTDPEQFKVVHCGLDFNRYFYRPPKQEVKRIFCAARLSPEKGHSVILHALKRLLDDGYGLELELAGDGPCREGLIALSQELGIADRVRFLGSLSEDDVARKLQNADLFVLPSFVEGVPVSAMEAMAVGVPVIATNIAGTSELVEDGKTGLLIRPSDFQVLANAVVKMIDDYDFRLRAAELARKKVVVEFNVDKEAVKLNEYLLKSCV